MSEDAEDGVELGPDERVEGVPIAQVAARLTWGISASRIRRREGSTVVRTPDGPQELATLLEATDRTYFDRREEFRAAIDEVISAGPVPAESPE